MQDVINWLRNLLLAKVGERLDFFSRMTVGELQGRILKDAEITSAKRLLEMIDIFLKRRQRIGESPLPQLSLELSIIESCEHIKESASNEIASA